LRLDLPCDLHEVRRLRAANVELPPHNEEMPDDLYPRSLQEPKKELPVKEEPKPHPLDPEIEQGFEILGYPPAKQKATLEKYGDKKEELLKDLNAELDQKQAKKEEKKPAAAKSGRNSERSLF